MRTASAAQRYRDALLPRDTPGPASARQARTAPFPTPGKRLRGARGLAYAGPGFGTARSAPTPSGTLPAGDKTAVASTAQERVAASPQPGSLTPAPAHRCVLPLWPYSLG